MPRAQANPKYNGPFGKIAGVEKHLTGLPRDTHICFIGAATKGARIKRPGGGIGGRVGLGGRDKSPPRGVAAGANGANGPPRTPQKNDGDVGEDEEWDVELEDGAGEDIYALEYAHNFIARGFERVSWTTPTLSTWPRVSSCAHILNTYRLSHSSQVNVVLGGYPALARHLMAIGCTVTHPTKRVISIPTDLTRITDVSSLPSSMSAASSIIMSVSSKEGASFDDTLNLSGDALGGVGGGEGSALQQVSAHRNPVVFTGTRPHPVSLAFALAFTLAPAPARPARPLAVALGHAIKRPDLSRLGRVYA